MKHKDDSIVSDELVLNYHLMHPGGDSAPGDPNLAYCLDGTYHLHYILRHPWKGDPSVLPPNHKNQSYSFIHVTSTDMLNWTWRTTKLQPSFTGTGMFSGTGFITKEGKPAAIYAGLHSTRHSYIVEAKDDTLETWEKPYPVLPKGGPGGKDISLGGDPDCFVVGDTYYAYSAVQDVQLCKSTDLHNWQYVGPFLQHDMPDVAVGEDLSCANMYELGNKWMVLCISHPIGCRYYLGDWDSDAEQFVPELHGRMNWRRPGQSLTAPGYRDFFAPESVLTQDGRRVMWAWLTTANPAIDLKSVQSLPRELSLGDDGSLRIHPLRELETLRYDEKQFRNIEVSAVDEEGPPFREDQLITDVDAEAFEVRVSVDRKEAERRRFGFLLFSDEESNGLPVLIRPEDCVISIGETEAPFTIADLPPGEDVDLRIFVDKYLVEVFVNGRQALLHAYMDYKDAGKGLRAYLFRRKGTPMKIGNIMVWKLRPTNQGFLEARDNRIWAPDVD